MTLLRTSAETFGEPLTETERYYRCKRGHEWTLNVEHDVLPRRWTVERTFVWLLNYRRHSRDYEVRTENSEAMIQVSMIHLLLKRLA